MRLSFPVRLFFILFAFLAVMMLGVLAPVSSYAASPSSKDFVETRKNKKKKTAKKKAPKKTAKTAPVLRAKNLVPYKEPVHKEDPLVSEPSEMIVAIKNRAQRAYWEGRKPLKEQLANPQAGAQALAAAETSNTLKRVSYSDVVGVTFDDQPLKMGASETFRRSLETVSFELGTPCRKPEEMYHEYFGWPLQQTEQARVDRIFEETQAKLKLRGFSVMPHRPRSVGSDVSVFSGERLKKHFIGLWSAGDAGLLLLVCETEKHNKPVAAAAPEKTKKKAIKPRKKKPAAVKKKKIEVIPGASSAEAPPSSINAPSSTPAAGSPPAAFNPTEAPKTDAPPATEVKPVETKPADPAPAPPPAAPVTETKPAETPAPPPAAVPEAPKTDAAPTVSDVLKDAAKDAVKDVVPTPTAPSVADVVKDAAKDAAKDAVKDAVKEAVPVPELPSVPAAPSIPAIP